MRKRQGTDAEKQRGSEYIKPKKPHISKNFTAENSVHNKVYLCE